MTPLIELRGIRKTYSDGHEALRGVNLALGEGMFGLLGPNGAGKTTLLSILVLAIEPTSGTMHFDGIDASSGRARLEIRRQIGKPFWLDTVGRSDFIEIRVKLDDSILRVAPVTGFQAITCFCMSL